MYSGERPIGAANQNHGLVHPPPPPGQWLWFCRSVPPRVLPPSNVSVSRPIVRASDGKTFDAAGLSGFLGGPGCPSLA